MHIVFAVSECAPFAKTGGLADVASALPRELVKQGHQATVYLPLYRQVSDYLASKGIKPVVRLASVTVPFSYYNRFASILDAGKFHGVQVYLVDMPELFQRGGIYGDAGGDYRDNPERFGGFSRAVLEATKQLGVPDCFHVHDWQTSLLTLLLRTTYFFDPLLRNVPSLLTIHNCGYQGWFPASAVETMMLPWDVFTPAGVELFGAFNSLKGGIVYADAITAVSRRYAEEIKQQEFGMGLDTVLRQRAGDLFGILNGADYSEWDPATDHHLAANYSAADLSGKHACREDLLRMFGLEHIGPQTAVLGIVSRFASQKGFDIFAGAADAVLQEDVALVVLGTGERMYEEMFRALQRRYPGKVAVRIEYDNALAHKVEAGADIFLMPSRYEPCGLNQIYSLKYGTVPLVRATGGLDDTIEQWDPATNSGTGFKFQGTSSYDFLVALRWAVLTFQNKVVWTALMRTGMAQNFDWKQAAEQYAGLYAELKRRRG